MSKKVVLDYETIKALSYSTRLDILKSLKEKNKTLSEISEDLDLKPATIKEHLQKLLDSDLISKEDTDRKWKYYSLTSKGKKLVFKKEFNVKFMLFGSFLLSIVSGYFFIREFFPGDSTTEMYKAADTTMRTMAAEAPQQATANFPWLFFVAFLIFVIVFGISLGILIKKGDNHEKLKMD